MSSPDKFGNILPTLAKLDELLKDFDLWEVGKDLKEEGRAKRRAWFASSWERR